MASFIAYGALAFKTIHPLLLLHHVLLLQIWTNSALYCYSALFTYLPLDSIEAMAPWALKRSAAALLHLGDMVQ